MANLVKQIFLQSDLINAEKITGDSCNITSLDLIIKGLLKRPTSVNLRLACVFKIKKNIFNMLCERFDRSFFVKRLIYKRDSYLFPSASKREAWSMVASGAQHRHLVSEITASAKALIDQPWPTLSASLFSQFMKNGNRTNYQTPYFKIRNNLYWN